MVPAELFDVLGLTARASIAALRANFARRYPRRRLLVDSKGTLVRCRHGHLLRAASVGAWSAPGRVNFRVSAKVADATARTCVGICASVANGSASVGVTYGGCVASRTVLLTGAAGLLGTWLRRTAPVGPTLVGVTYRRRLRDGAEIVADVKDPNRVAAAMHRVRPSVVIHAAYAHDRGSIVAATQNVVDAARDVGAAVVYVSTNAVFCGDGKPRDEGAPPDPIWDYGRWKAQAESAVSAGSALSAIVRLPLIVSLDPIVRIARPRSFMSAESAQISTCSSGFRTRDVSRFNPAGGRAGVRLFRVVPHPPAALIRAPAHARRSSRPYSDRYISNTTSLPPVGSREPVGSRGAFPASRLNRAGGRASVRSDYRKALDRTSRHEPRWYPSRHGPGAPRTVPRSLGGHRRRWRGRRR
jgi:hypothetical protein